MSAIFLLVSACGDIQVQPIGEGSGNINAGGGGACGDGNNQTGAGGAGFGGGTVAVVSTTGAGGAGFGGNLGAGGASTDECMTVSDCPVPVGTCVEALCQGGFCFTIDSPAGTPAAVDLPGDCIDVVCGGSGGVLLVADDSETPDDGNECTSNTCSGGVAFTQNLSGTSCTVAGGAGTCVAGSCQGQGACNNGLQDGSETDVDCGGPACMTCSTGQTCLVGADCNSGVCSANLCQ